ncbi:ABC transporter permease [Streptomyces sp. NPDC056169]|uniref:ABC transporter permease n=1 Tax=Streptomyces sp. NPDC056169 TaxID=3345734 RepID=UPI0035DE00BB
MSTLALKGPSWVTVRQYRRTLWLAGAGVLLSLVGMVWVRYWDSRTVGTNGVHAHSLLRIAVDWAQTGMTVVPFLVGAFVAGPMVARELESGTYKLALTQSVSPARWLGTKLAVAGAVTAVGTITLIGAYRLGWANLGDTSSFLWYQPGTYVSTGPVLVAQSLFALALGSLIGQLVRRTVTAMALTGLVTGLVLLVIASLRWSLIPVKTLTGPLPGTHGISVDIASRGTETGLLTATGERLPSHACFDRTEHWDVCPADMNVTGSYWDYHPASHFWPTQLIETGIVLALAALALYAAFRVLRARHA